MTDAARTLNCEQADALLAEWAVGGVEATEQRALRRHLGGCATCRAAGAGYLRTADVLALAVDDAEPPPELRSRLLAAVHAEATGTSTLAGARWWRRLWERLPAGRGFTVAGGALTAAAVAAAVVLGVTRGGTPAPALSLVSACGSGAAQNVCGTLRYDAADRQAVLSVTGLSVSSHGGVPDATYEAWFIHPDGSVQAAAYLTPSPGGGDYSAAMTSDMSAFVAVALTREPFGGSDKPTTTPFISFDLHRLAPST